MDSIKEIHEIITNIVLFFGQFGIIGAIGMALLEAIFPSLPLIAIAGININNYGFMGFIFTYIGSVSGTLIVFVLIRTFFTDKFQDSNFLKKHKRIIRFMNWIEYRGLSSIMVMMSLPFLPTSLINYACALSRMRKREFLYAVIVSKAVSIGLLSYIGSSLIDFIDKPYNALIALILLVIVYIISKIIEKRLK
ncbi:VTT domain-containing protein [Erysipelotrichaceae bacterium OttesenSCG-928-M19]|nr:VTT domain-containing protein [Erysipelotrichaceae bacterium OttesenSCG-928-M19]